MKKLMLLALFAPSSALADACWIQTASDLSPRQCQGSDLVNCQNTPPSSMFRAIDACYVIPMVFGERDYYKAHYEACSQTVAVLTEHLNACLEAGVSGTDLVARLRARCGARCNGIH